MVGGFGDVVREWRVFAPVLSFTAGLLDSVFVRVSRFRRLGIFWDHLGRSEILLFRSLQFWTVCFFGPFRLGGGQSGTSDFLQTSQASTGFKGVVGGEADEGLEVSV